MSEEEVLRVINEAPMGRDWGAESAPAILKALNDAELAVVPLTVQTAWGRLVQWGEDNGANSYVTGVPAPPTPEELVSIIIGILEDH